MRALLVLVLAGCGAGAAGPDDLGQPDAGGALDAARSPDAAPATPDAPQTIGPVVAFTVVANDPAAIHAFGTVYASVYLEPASNNGSDIVDIRWLDHLTGVAVGSSERFHWNGAAGGVGLMIPGAAMRDVAGGGITPVAVTFYYQPFTECGALTATLGLDFQHPSRPADGSWAFVPSFGAPIECP